MSYASRPWVAILCAALLAGVSVGRTAAQESVYGPGVPGGSALVRVANVDGATASAILDIGSLRFTPVPARDVTAYRPVDPGIYLVGRRGSQVEFLPQPERYYTVVVASGMTPVVFADTTHTDPSRAQLVLFNASSSAVELRAVEPSARVIGPVQPGASGARVVNAVSVELSITIAGENLMTERLELERGASYSFFALDDGGFVAAATVEPR